ncbi:MAG: aminotransferase class I/II-fold pyridoxal phosphate-dependent enzyme [Spirochaetia bacterium]|jgi:aspartate/methionine/tyrosine aminotransferase
MQLPPFAVERYFARHEFAVPWLLCSSDCESMSIQDLLSLEPGAAERFCGQWLGYTESAGSPTLREEIARGYADITPAQVLVHAGAEEAIFLFMQAALVPGDHLIVHWPCYQSLFEVARGIGCEVSTWQAREEKGWAVDPSELTRLIRSSTKAIVINVPHNPTGYHMPRETFAEVLKIAETHGVAVLSDEVYRGLEPAAAERLPAACELSASAVSLGVMSKTYGLAGLRIGWVASRNATVLSRMAALKDYTTICCSAPSEHLAELALRHGEQIASRNRAIIAANLPLLDSFFARHADRFTWQRPKAGPIAFPRLLGREVSAFCDACAAGCGVLLLPGTLYGDAGNHFRIGFGRKNMSEALARLEEFLAAVPSA